MLHVLHVLLVHASYLAKVPLLAVSTRTPPLCNVTTYRTVTVEIFYQYLGRILMKALFLPRIEDRFVVIFHPMCSPRVMKKMTCYSPSPRTH